MTAFYHLVLEALADAVFETTDNGQQRRERHAMRRVAGALITVFQVGRSVHIAADAIHTYACEVHPEYKEKIPEDMLELIHFLDEDLGHWLLFAAYYALLSLLTYCFCPTPAASKGGRVDIGTCPGRRAMIPAAKPRRDRAAPMPHVDIGGCRTSCLSLSMSAFLSVSLTVFTHTRARARTHTRMHARTRARAHTHTHTHISSHHITSYHIHTGSGRRRSVTAAVCTFCRYN